MIDIAIVTIIDQQYKNIVELIQYLNDKKELTFLNVVEDNFKKTFLLSIASYFENEISNIIMESANAHASNNELIVSLIKNKAVCRQYHTYFRWDVVNANSFFGLFGSSFLTKMTAKVKTDKDLDEAIKAFLAIGNERNKVVHENLAEVSIDKTTKEIYDLYRLALYFVATIRMELTRK